MEKLNSLFGRIIKEFGGADIAIIYYNWSNSNDDIKIELTNIYLSTLETLSELITNACGKDYVVDCIRPYVNSAGRIIKADVQLFQK